MYDINKCSFILLRPFLVPQTISTGHVKYMYTNKYIGNFVAKTVLVESANQFSLEELCRTQYSLQYFFRSHIDHQTYGKTLTLPIIRCITHELL